MNKSLPAVVGCLSVIASFSSIGADNTLKTQKDKVSYSIGLQMGSQMTQFTDSVDIDKIIMGLKDGHAGKKPQLSVEEIQSVMTAFKLEVQAGKRARQQAGLKVDADKNGKEGKKFLSENKNKEGVVTLPSGLQYKVLTKGNGATPKETDTVVTHYRGSLIDGRVFDSSHKRGQPASFPVTGVIKGWTEALQKMKVGGKWQLFIPSDLAYGSRGAGAMIGPNAVLIFEIQLLEIKSDS